ncbi:MAG: DUF2283 domain-containing protein [Cyanobacteriota bacterium]|jgi:uncharacterized protein YuzE
MATTTLNPLDILRYRTLANAIGNLPRENLWMAYDATADALYINFHQPALSADDSELTQDNIIIRYRQDQVIGLTLLNVSQRR